MKTAHFGYTYQHWLSEFFLVMMDVERAIDVLEIEVSEEHNFDDVTITIGDSKYFFQFKDFSQIRIEQLSFDQDSVYIKKKKHLLSKHVNILIFKSIELLANDQVLGIPSFLTQNVHIVSLSRSEIEDRIQKLYENNSNRIGILHKFLSQKLDSRTLTIKRSDLPTINKFSTRLLEPTIDAGRKLLDFDDLLFIEGKPGVGKSHYVDQLTKEYPNNILYRFWVSDQDRDRHERLKYTNFLFELSKQLFTDQKGKDESAIVNKINKQNRTVIIDGLDHVENYNNSDLEKYIKFIEQLKANCKTIVLSRPLYLKVDWKKQVLGDWNSEQTKTVLDQLFHITDRHAQDGIYSITNGYPILVKYVAEQYKSCGQLPDLGKLEKVDDYYETLIESQKSKQALAVFLCFRSFLLSSEIELFLERGMALLVKEFIKENPALFEIRLNRISLYHDSFNTFLRKLDIDCSFLIDTINKTVYKSIMRLEKQFLSRFDSFDLSAKQNMEIVKHYASLDNFKLLTCDLVDYESIPVFYEQVREVLGTVNPDQLEAINYYDLGLILNLVARYNDENTNNPFLYTYIKTLQLNGYKIDEVTSNGYLFAMWYFKETGDSILLCDTTSDNLYDTSRFYQDLQEDIKKEERFFEHHQRPLTKKEATDLIEDKTYAISQDYISYLLENLFFQESLRNEYPELYQCIKDYMEMGNNSSVYILEHFLEKHGYSYFHASNILKKAKTKILALGACPSSNDYLNLNLEELIQKTKQDHSYDASVDIQNFMRLSCHHKKSIDIKSISSYWGRYQSRNDYTLYSVHIAFRVFEDAGFIEMANSIRYIHSIQKRSEKGYRGLLSEYIEQYPPSKIIPFFVDNFETSDLIIEWFLLPPEYINKFPDELYDLGIQGALNWKVSKDVDYYKIANVLKSKRKTEFLNDLNLMKFWVRMDHDNEDISLLEMLDVRLTIKEEDKYGSTRDRSDYFSQGILTSLDFEVIKKHNLSPSEVASYSDGNHFALADLGMYDFFKEDEVRDNIKSILRNALTGKSTRIDYFNTPYYFPGNILKLLCQYQIPIDLNLFHSHFQDFLKLSLVEMSNNDKKD